MPDKQDYVNMVREFVQTSTRGRPAGLGLLQLESLVQSADSVCHMLL